MKKHKIELSYKDLHAIKHSLENTLKEKSDAIDNGGWDTVFGFVDLKDGEKIQIEKDMEHETNLLERITEKIYYLKDLYKIK